MGITLKLPNPPEGIQVNTNRTKRSPLLPVVEKVQVDIEHRIGKFHLPEAIATDPDFLGLMAYMLILRCEHIYYTRIFEYVACSPLFDEIGPQSHPPSYAIEFQRTEDGTYVKAIRQKE